VSTTRIAYGRSGESHWLWLVIIGAGVAIYLAERSRGRPRQVRSWADVADRLHMVGAAWWAQATFLATIGGGSLYHLATGGGRWFWWLLPAVAWASFVWVVVTRDGDP
jgi:hypothetical protein